MVLMSRSFTPPPQFSHQGKTSSCWMHTILNLSRVSCQYFMFTMRIHSSRGKGMFLKSHRPKGDTRLSMPLFRNLKIEALGKAYAEERWIATVATEVCIRSKAVTENRPDYVSFRLHRNKTTRDGLTTALEMKFFLTSLLQNGRGLTGQFDVVAEKVLDPLF